VTTRVPAVAVMLGGLAMAVLPVLPWYTVRIDGREARASGIATAGELWLLPVLGAAALAAGLLLTTGPRPAGSYRARGVATVAGLAGLVGLLWALVAALDPPVRLTVPGAGLGGSVAAPVALAPAAYLTPAACALVLVAAVALGRVRIPWARVRAYLRPPAPPRR
jgi:hypothetical protein